MKNIVFVFKYLKYYFSSVSKHGVHSPFVFDLVVNVFEDKKIYTEYQQIEELRIKLTSSSQVIDVKDYGAGSVINGSSKRKVGDIARNSAKSPKYGQLLFRLVKRFKPQNIVEIGTSLGISTLYQSLHFDGVKLITLEGCPQTAELAKANFKSLNVTNIKLVIGNFDESLESVLENLKSVDYVFFDGNHRKEPTIKYFEQCLEKTHNDTIFVFDDIHWSDEMEEAWKWIKNHKKVTVTIDLFFLGLVFFRKEQVKQHFLIKH